MHDRRFFCLASLFSTVVLLLCVLLLGFLVGVVAWLFLFLVHLVLALVWEALPLALGIGGTQGWGAPLPPFWFVLAVTCVGAVALFLNERHNRARVAAMMPVMAQIRKTGRYEYRGRMIPGYFCSAFLPLAFGSSVGPEAGLTNVLASLGTWVGDVIRALVERLRLAMREGRVLRWADVRTSFVAPWEAPRPLARPWGTAVYALAVLGGAVGLLAMSWLVGSGLGFPRLPGISWEPGWLLEQLVWLIPCIALGVAAGVIFSLFDVASRRLGAALSGHGLVRNLIVALALSALGACIPCVLFSGQEALGTVVTSWQSIGPGMLVGMAFARCLLTPLCIHCGWEGGQFFPLIFIGVALGYAASLLTGADPVFCASITAASLLGVIMRRPLAALIVLLLVMPLGTVPLMLLVGVAVSALPFPHGWGIPPARRFGRAARAGDADNMG